MSSIAFNISPLDVRWIGIRTSQNIRGKIMSNIVGFGVVLPDDFWEEF